MLERWLIATEVDMRTFVQNERISVIIRIATCSSSWWFVGSCDPVMKSTGTQLCAEGRERVYYHNMIG